MAETKLASKTSLNVLVSGPPTILTIVLTLKKKEIEEENLAIILHITKMDLVTSKLLDSIYHNLRSAIPNK
ncbi:hypothetical protein CRE_30167 [Caenorhabditis remanei]|uniref:Uncharacterized protein n=1 Tax=Caenorhabditis remanei TaxID=31234 RepID=E3NE20_CAERE|nr:hypothetical protein CRE_30167 [Caenorhabditis remanei]